MDNDFGEAAESGFGRLYRVAGVAALVAVLVVAAEMGITFLPGASASPETVVDWFTLLQDSWFLGLRNLGLINLVFAILGIPVFRALFGAHRRSDELFAALAMVVSFIGLAVFLATNRAFAMLDLSRRYAVAATDSQTMVLEAAGQTMLSVGESHVPGTFLGFFLSEAAGIMISVVMWRGRVFSRPSAVAGALGFGLLLVYDVLASFVPGSGSTALVPAMVGGLLNVAWYLLTALRLLQLGRRAWAPYGTVWFRAQLSGRRAPAPNARAIASRLCAVDSRAAIPEKLDRQSRPSWVSPVPGVPPTRRGPRERPVWQGWRNRGMIAEGPSCNATLDRRRICWS